MSLNNESGYPINIETKSNISEYEDRENEILDLSNTFDRKKKVGTIVKISKIRDEYKKPHRKVNFKEFYLRQNLYESKKKQNQNNIKTTSSYSISLDLTFYIVLILLFL